MKQKAVSKGNNVNKIPQKSKVINVGTTGNVKLQAYKKAVLQKATQEINKIEEDIKNLEQNTF